MFDFIFNLQMFATAGTVVNATTAYVNSDTGATTAFSGNNTLSPTMKTYYDTELLENARSELIFAQFARKQGLPANKGRTVEWRKWNTLPDAKVLQEGVLPTGEKMGMTVLNTSLEQYGLYVGITDILDLHAIDNVLLGATEELGASAGESMDKLIRNELVQNTNVMYCDTVNADGSTSPVTMAANLKADNNRLTPAMVNKAVTWLKKCKAPKINGKYVAIIHPSVSFDLRESDGWIEAHKYANTTEIFNGEIGELHGVRFVETTNAKVTQQTLKSGSGMVYTCLFLGKDAYGVVDPEGGAMEMIIKNKSQAGGPLEQFSTAGYKFEDCTKTLYPERIIRVECCSAFSNIDVAN
jgi:N4-gp56 family major capsid protein